MDDYTKPKQIFLNLGSSNKSIENSRPRTEEEVKLSKETTEDKEGFLQTLEACLRQSVLSLEKEIYDLKYENNRLSGMSSRRKSLLEIEEAHKLEKNSTKVINKLIKNPPFPHPPLPI